MIVVVICKNKIATTPQNFVMMRCNKKNMKDKKEHLDKWERGYKEGFYKEVEEPEVTIVVIKNE